MQSNLYQIYQKHFIFIIVTVILPMTSEWPKSIYGKWIGPSSELEMESIMHEITTIF